MTTQHTPGPWHVGCQNDALFVTAGRKPALNNDHPRHDAPRVALCKVFGPSDGDCLPVDADANARLIAAAPELLEALIEAREALHFHYVEWDGEPEDAVPLQLARSKCDEAIAKARGEA